MMDNNNAADSANARTKKELSRLFQDIQHDIPILLFTDPFKNPQFTDLTRKVIRMIRGIAPKVGLREFGLDHDLAKELGITHAPTLVFDHEHFNIRWLGAPLGEEGRTFVEALVMIGMRETRLNEQAGKILDKIEEPRQLKVFVSPTCPYCPQQAVNGLKAAIERPDIVSLEIIDVQLNQDLAKKYSAHSVPQVWANEKLIAMGAQPEELFMASVDKLEQQTVFIPESDAEVIDTDLVIVGGGPAGLTAGIYAERSGLRSVVVEKGALGGQVATTPVVENYPGLTHIGGKTLVDIMVTHALEYVKIFPDEEVMDIQPGDPLVVKTSRRRFNTRAVLLATGATHRKLGVPGEIQLSGRGVSYCSTCDGPLFKGRKVIMAGGGNSALTEALHLHNLGVDVSIVHRRDSFRAQDNLVHNLKGSGIRVLFHTEVEEIHGREKVESVTLKNNKTGERQSLAMDGVFVAIGYEPAVALAGKIGAEITDEGYIKRDNRHRTTVRGVYSAGDVVGGYKQIVIAAGQGAEAALAIFEDLMNPYWKDKA